MTAEKTGVDWSCQRHFSESPTRIRRMQFIPRPLRTGAVHFSILNLSRPGPWLKSETTFRPEDVSTDCSPLISGSQQILRD